MKVIENLSPAGSMLAFMLITLIHYEFVYQMLLSLILSTVTIILARLIKTDARAKNPHKTTGYRFIDKILKRKTISGHVSRLAILALNLGYLLHPVYYLIIILAMLVGIQRVNKKYHTTNDVILAFFLALVSSSIAIFTL